MTRGKTGDVSTSHKRYVPDTTETRAGNFSLALGDPGTAGSRSQVIGVRRPKHLSDEAAARYVASEIGRTRSVVLRLAPWARMTDGEIERQAHALWRLARRVLAVIRLAALGARGGLDAVTVGASVRLVETLVDAACAPPDMGLVRTLEGLAA